jgi:sugar lactone lactonase YvrE
VSADCRYVFDVGVLGEPGSWTLENRRVFAHCDKGFPDGIKCDTLGNVYSGCGDGVHVFPFQGWLMTGVEHFRTSNWENCSWRTWVWEPRLWSSRDSIHLC